MPFEHADRLREGTRRNGYAPEVRRFPPNGSLEAPDKRVAPLPTLGTSRISFEKFLKLTAVAATLASTVTLTHDPAMAQALVREGLPVPNESWPLARASTAESETAARVSELRALLAALDDEPVEDGAINPVEAQLSEYLTRYGTAELRIGVFGAASTLRIAGALQLLGRVRGTDTSSREQLLRAGLKSPSVEVRDAALQAAELWEDPSLASIIRAHVEPTPWLADYASRVARELEG